jgi:hypothetical protein
MGLDAVHQMTRRTRLPESVVVAVIGVLYRDSLIYPSPTESGIAQVSFFSLVVDVLLF